MEDFRDTRDRARDEEVIRAVEAAYDAAWDAGDLGALIALLTADAVVVDPFGGVTEGREAVGRAFASLFEAGARGSTHQSKVIGVRFVTDDVAVLDGEATVEGLPDAVTGREGPVVHGFTDVFARCGETWRISQVRAYAFMARPRS
jgi:uncharacterized protein (TIGR02246 family)